MTLAAVGLLALALGLAWWVVRRAVRFRREAESREARALEALFISRQRADGGASIEVDRIFGAAPVPPAPATVSMPLVLADRGGLPAASRAAPEPAAADEAVLAPPAPVRDLVQVFYEARGFLAEPADRSALPIETVMAHKSDARRAYAFAPLLQPPSPAALQSMIDRAGRIGQKRLLIAVEGELAAGPEVEVPAHGVRVLDRAAIEAQLARLDADVADRIRATAWRRAGRRLRDG